MDAEHLRLHRGQGECLSSAQERPTPFALATAAKRRGQTAGCDPDHVDAAHVSEEEILIACRHLDALFDLGFEVRRKLPHPQAQNEYGEGINRKQRRAGNRKGKLRS